MDIKNNWLRIIVLIIIVFAFFILTDPPATPRDDKGYVIYYKDVP